METFLNLSLIPEFFTVIFSKLDTFLLANFQVETSFAENTEQTIVYIFTVLIICVLFALITSDSHQRRKRVNFTDAKPENTKLKQNIKNISSGTIQDPATEDNEDAIAEKGVVNVNEQDNGMEALHKPNIFELDNGFVINRRHAGVKDILKQSESEDVIANNDEEQYKKNNISEFLSINNSDPKTDLTRKLSDIEAAMLDVRQEFKSGKISSTDYLSKTQALYKKGEVLIEKQSSSAR